MIDTPTERNSQNRPLKVLIETYAGSGDPRPNPRVECQSLFLGCDDQLSKATLKMHGWPIDRSDLTAEPALRPGDVLDGVATSGVHTLISADQQIAIVRELVDEGSENPPPPQLLFKGHCGRITFHENTSEGKTEQYFLLEVESQFAQLDREPRAIIAGSWMRKAAAADAAAAAGSPPDGPSGGPDDCQIVRGVPCVFNPLYAKNGNCHRRPITVNIDGYPQPVRVHVMCDPNDPDATLWTWAKAMRYLVFFHVMQYASGAAWPDQGVVSDGLAGAAVPECAPGGTFERTESFYTLASDQRPNPPATRSTAWKFAGLGEPRNWPCEGLLAREALNALSVATGLHHCCRHERDSTGTMRNRLYWWPRGGGPIKDLYREVTFANQAGMTAAQILAKSNVNQMALEADYADVTPNPYAPGAVRHYEVTTELVPGWKKDANLDDVPAGQVDAKLAYAEAHWGLSAEEDLNADPWYRDYHRKGLNFGAHAATGRKWIANTAAAYRAADYARTLGPFTAARYAPWEPSHPYGPGATALDDAKLNEPLRDPYLVWVAGTPGHWDVAVPDNAHGLLSVDWARVARPFQPCFAADEYGRSLGILVEFSIDSGAHWSRLTSTARALPHEAAIVLDEDDLTQIALKTETDEKHFWQALLENTLRLRVTAVIAGDLRIEPTVDNGPFGPAVQWMRTRYFDVADRYLANDIRAGNSIHRTGCTRAVTHYVPEHRFELVELQKYCDQLLQVLCKRQMAGTPVIPWLTTQSTPGDVDGEHAGENGEGYAIGDGLRAIRGLGINLRGGSAAAPESYADIVGITYTNQSTTLLLEDFRWKDTVMPKGTADYSGQGEMP